MTAWAALRAALAREGWGWACSFRGVAYFQQARYTGSERAFREIDGSWVEVDPYGTHEPLVA